MEHTKNTNSNKDIYIVYYISIFIVFVTLFAFVYTVKIFYKRRLNYTKKIDFFPNINIFLSKAPPPPSYFSEASPKREIFLRRRKPQTWKTLPQHESIR